MSENRKEKFIAGSNLYRVDYSINHHEYTKLIVANSIREVISYCESWEIIQIILVEQDISMVLLVDV